MTRDVDERHKISQVLYALLLGWQWTTGGYTFVIADTDQGCEMCVQGSASGGASGNRSILLSYKITLATFMCMVREMPDAEFADACQFVAMNCPAGVRARKGMS